jgi:peptidase M49-like protein
MMTPVALALALAAAPAAGPAAPPAEFPDAAALARREARYAPVALTVDVSRLAAPERQALARLVEAARLMDALFLRQVWAGNEALLAELAGDPTPLGRARLAALLRNKGPWDRLDAEAPFLPGVGEKPAPANFYPVGASKAEVEAWLAALPPAEQAAAAGFFTVVRRLPDGRLAAVPYSVEYQGELALAADLLEEAARLTADPALRAFLTARAAAFRGNDYRPSDVAWMRLDGAIEPTIGPYEVYEDGWLNAKAAFEAFVGVRDDAETARLARFSAELQGIEDALPIDQALKNPRLGALAPIRVINELFAAGDAARGVTTAAYNLPNDEVVLKEMGSKRVMLKNVQQAKFDKVLLPISRVALSPLQRDRVGFDAFFTHILMHELVHGLGPHEVRAPGAPPATVRARLGDAYSAIEEAKADVGGLFALQKLLDEGKLDKGLQATLYPTFLASTFRSLRFGLTEAHGKGMALQLGWFMDAGAVWVLKDGTFAIDPVKMRAAVTSLTRELMHLQARGDRAAALALLERLAVLRPPVQRVLERLQGVPVDIAPRFVTAEALTRRPATPSAPKLPPTPPVGPKVEAPDR